MEGLFEKSFNQAEQGLKEEVGGQVVKQTRGIYLIGQACVLKRRSQSKPNVPEDQGGGELGGNRGGNQKGGKAGAKKSTNRNPGKGGGCPTHARKECPKKKEGEEKNGTRSENKEGSENRVSHDPPT